MENKNKNLMTLEERLKYAAESRASSPEAAVRMVRKFSEIPAGYFFCGQEDLAAMNELTGKFWEHPSVDVDTYHGFCQTFRLAIIYDTARRMQQQPETMLSLEDSSNPYQPIWDAGTVNAVILLGLMLLDHAKDRGKNKDIYHCMRMTLGQYLDALAGLGLWTDGSPGLAQGFQGWRDMLLADYGAASPLGETLAGILRRYMAAWQEFDHLDYILRCIGTLSCCLEQEEAGRTLPGEETDRVRRFRETLCEYGSDLEGREPVEQDKRYLDPKGYYFTLACEYPENLPDPGDRNVAPGSLRSQIFLSERDYSPETLRGLAAGSPSPDLRTLLERYVCEERLASAMREVNTAVAGIYVLFVEPYLRIGGAGAEPPQNLPTAAAAGRMVFPPE